MLYIPQIDVNLLNGIRHYKAGGVLIKKTFYGSNHKPMAALNFEKLGFFLTLKDQTLPKVHYLYYHCHAIKHRLRLPKTSGFTNPVIIKIPNNPPINKDNYQYIFNLKSSKLKIRPKISLRTKKGPKGGKRKPLVKKPFTKGNSLG